MEEKYDLHGEDGMKFKKGKFGLWLENFLYHYKWYAIATIFVIVVGIICTVQMCSKPEYDVYIIYAGGYDAKNPETENDIPPYQTIQKSINEAVLDFDENGEVRSAFETLFMLSEKEIAEVEKKIQELKEKGEEYGELNYSQLQMNNSTFRDRITFSDYYIYLISDSIYEAYQKSEGEEKVFVSLKGYVEEGTEVEFLDDSAIYLSSTEFGKLPGLCDLPENTVIVLRNIGAVSSHFNKDEARETYSNAEKVVRNMINYEG